MILARIGPLLTSMSFLLDVFHMSLLKEYKGPQPDGMGDLPADYNGKTLPNP